MSRLPRFLGFGLSTSISSAAFLVLIRYLFFYDIVVLLRLVFYPITNMIHDLVPQHIGVCGLGPNQTAVVVVIGHTIQSGDCEPRKSKNARWVVRTRGYTHEGRRPTLAGPFQLESSSP